MNSEPETITREVSGSIGRLTLSRPDSLNPLSAQTLRELIDTAAWFDRRPDVKVVVVSGSGRAFCAGADLSAFTGSESQPTREMSDLGRVMIEAVEAMKAVTIAAVHGHCVGAGVLLAAACDLRVATESTRWAIPEVDIGIPLAWGGIPRLVREIGPAATRELVLTCRPFTSREVYSLGMLNEVVDDDALAERVDRLAEQLSAKSSYTLRATLRAVDTAAEALVSTGGAWTDADAFLVAINDPESRDMATRYLSERTRRD